MELSLQTDAPAAIAQSDRHELSVDVKLTDVEAIALISNALEPPPDEGIKRCGQELASLLRKRGGRIFSIQKEASWLARALFLDPRLLRSLRRSEIRVIVYIPTQSGTLGTLLRAWILRAGAGVATVVIALQPRTLGRSQRLLARMLKPHLIMSPSHVVLAQAEALSAPAVFLPLGVDTNRFVPVDGERKRQLRQQYGLPERGPIALHVGHARPLRGLESLVELQEEHHDLTCVVVIGSSLGSDPSIVRTLREGGVKVIDSYLPDIQECYQLADVYVFPVYDEDAAIGAPLSVLEAMACNLAVVTSPFGALPDMVKAANGFFYAHSQPDIAPAVDRALGLDRDEIRTRIKVEAYSWTAIADRIVTKAGELSDAL